MTSTTRLLLRSGALGLAAGGRASLGVLGPALAAGSTASTRLTAAMAAGEIVVDKLPQTPSRLQPQSLVGRAASGSLGAAVLARREGHAPWVAAVTGGLGAVAGSFVGAAWRQAVADRGWGLRGAVLEDAAALGLVAFAVRRRR